MKKIIVLLVFLFTTLFSFGELSSSPIKTNQTTPRFIRPPHVDPEIWDSLSPCFLPEDHPIKPKLDEIFLKGDRVVLSSKTLKKAGFKDTTPRKYSGTIVATHKKLKGYIVKLYTDDQKGKIDWAYLKDRVTGANAVRASIENHNFGSIAKTPKKWIYPLPATPAPPAGMERKNFILIEEDVNVLGKNRSLAMWRTNFASRVLLNAVYIILNENGLIDCAYAFNMPFAEDGRIAFVDTEMHHRWPVPFHKLTPYLSTAGQAYWRQLIEMGGPK